MTLSVLDQVNKKLQAKGILQDYVGGFLEMETEGIVERIKVSPFKFGDYIWIPHRPVIKDAVQYTYEIRPVFNVIIIILGWQYMLL